MAPGQLGEHNARGTPCPESAACPAPRHTAGPARSHHLRSKRNATREPGGLGRFGAARGRTRTVSAGTTRTTNPARSRQRALPPRRTAGSPRSHRLRSVRSATREPGAAGPYGACGAGPSCGVKALRQGGARAAQAAHVPWAAASPTAQWYEPAGADERSAGRPASVERVPHRDGAAESPTGARTARRRPAPERPSATARCWHLCTGE